MAGKKKSNSLAGTIIFLVLAAAVVVGIYLSINRENKETKEIPVEETEADLILAKNLDKDYPATAREVLKTYCRITKCMYNDDLSDETIAALMRQLRKLYSPELLAANPEDTQLAFLLGEIGSYHEKKMSIYSYTVESAVMTKNIMTSAGKTNLINMYFTIRSDQKMERAYEEFSVYQDSEGHWKIMAWRPTDETNIIE